MVQIAEPRNEAFEEAIAEFKTFWDMAQIKIMEIKLLEKKTHQIVGKMVIYAEEEEPCDWRKAAEVWGEFR